MKGLWVLLWVTLNVLGSIMQNLSMPLWLNTLNKCGNPFVVYQIACTMFVVMFGLTVLFLSVFKGNSFWKYLTSLTFKGWGLLFLTGVFDSLNGILVVIASPIERTPPIIASTFPNIIFIFMIALIYFLHRKEWLPPPKIKKQSFISHEFVLFVLTYSMCVYTTIVATNEQEATADGKVYWWGVFLVGILFGYVYNQIQEIFFKGHGMFKLDQNLIHAEGPEAAHSCYVTDAEKLTTNNVTNFIPGVSLSPDETMACQYADTLEYSFTGMGLLWNLLFSSGYFIAYIASIGTNVVSTGLTMLMGPLSTTVIIVISYNISILTPDKDIINVYFFYPMILCGMLMTLFYSAWYNGTRVNQLTNIRVYFEKFVPDDVLSILDIDYGDSSDKIPLQTPVDHEHLDYGSASNHYSSINH